MQFPAATRRALRGIRWGLGAVQSLSMAQIITAAANAYGVDPALALAVAQRESGLNPNLVNPVSGAAGLMQLMPATFASLGGTNIMDPVQNANAGVRYLGMMLQQFGDVAEAVAAYDWGPGNLSNALAQYGSNWLAYAPTETQNYVLALTGETPSSIASSSSQNGAQQSQPGSQITTIDANTGQVVPNVDVSQLPQVTEAGIFPASSFSIPGGGAIDLSDPTTLAALGLAGIAAFFLLKDL